MVENILSALESADDRQAKQAEEEEAVAIFQLCIGVWSCREHGRRACRFGCRKERCRKAEKAEQKRLLRSKRCIEKDRARFFFPKHKHDDDWKAAIVGKYVELTICFELPLNRLKPLTQNGFGRLSLQPIRILP